MRKFQSVLLDTVIDDACLTARFRGLQYVCISRFTGLHQLLCESDHLRITLRGLQTLSEADAEHEHRCF